MHIAIEGCSHGELDIIYNTMQRLEEINRFKIDLLLCCGDFQSVRNEGDLKCMAVPTKYMQMQDFHRYYSGEKKAPVLTIFIGGNHEASNYLQELPYGGWVAPNIYYLGYAGVIRIGDLRIGGMSGIYKGGDYLKGHFERTPYSGSTMRSVYHIRNLEVFRLKQLSGNTDIFMSHDWPRGIYNYGNVQQLLRYKKHFKSEIDSNTLGSRPAEDLMKKIKPNYWFSGHLHVKFAAILPHGETNGKKEVTKFLALDKCLPRREFLQVLDLPSSPSATPEIKHDAEWLTILRLTNHLLSTKSNTIYMPGPGAAERYDFTPTPEEIKETVKLMGGDLTIPLSNFVQTAPPFGNGRQLPNMNHVQMPQPKINPQTTKFCSMLEIEDPLVRLLQPQEANKNPSKGNLVRSFNSTSFSGVPYNKSEMNITTSSLQTTRDSSVNLSSNPEEIELSDGEIEISKDEETGDFILEVPIISSFKHKPKLNISPIRGNGSSALSQELFSSPVASSPRITADELPRRSLTLSKSKLSSDLDLSLLEVSTNEGGLCRSSSLLETSSTSSLSSELPNISSLSSEDEDVSDRSASVKRGSDEEDLDLKSSSGDGKNPTKKFKRRNVSIYSTED